MDKIFEHLRDPKFVIGFNPDWRFYKQFIEAYIERADYMAWISPDGWLTRDGDREFRQKLVPGITKIIHNSRSTDRFPGIYKKQEGSTIAVWTRFHKDRSSIYHFDSGSPVTRDLETELQERGYVVPDPATTLGIVKQIRAMIGLSPLLVYARSCNLAPEEAKKQIVPADDPEAVPFYTHGWRGFVSRRQISCKTDFEHEFNIVFGDDIRAARKDGRTKLLDRMQVLNPGVCWPSIYLNTPATTLQEARSIISIKQSEIQRWLCSLTASGRRMAPTDFANFLKLDRTRLWTDEEIYEKAQLTTVQVQKIRSLILPWPSSDNQNALPWPSSDNQNA